MFISCAFIFYFYASYCRFICNFCPVHLYKIFQALVNAVSSSQVILVLLLFHCNFQPCSTLYRFSSVFAVHTVATQSCFLPSFARMHHFAKAVIYSTVELLKRILFALTQLVLYKPFAAKRFLFAYLYLYIGCLTCFTLHSQ